MLKNKKRWSALAMSILLGFSPLMIAADSEDSELPFQDFQEVTSPSSGPQEAADEFAEAFPESEGEEGKDSKAAVLAQSLNTLTSVWGFTEQPVPESEIYSSPTAHTINYLLNNEEKIVYDDEGIIIKTSTFLGENIQTVDSFVLDESLCILSHGTKDQIHVINMKTSDCRSIDLGALSFVPDSICMDNSGRFFVCDSDQIALLDSNGKILAATQRNTRSSYEKLLGFEETTQTLLFTHSQGGSSTYIYGLGAVSLSGGRFNTMVTGINLPSQSPVFSHFGRSKYSRPGRLIGSRMIFALETCDSLISFDLKDLDLQKAKVKKISWKVNNTEGLVYQRSLPIVSLGGGKMILTADGPSTLTLIDPVTMKTTARINVSGTIQSMTPTKGGFAVETVINGVTNVDIYPSPDLSFSVPSNIQVRVGESVTIPITTTWDITPEVRSSQPSIASVSDPFEVFGWKPGKCTITFEGPDGLKKQCTVTVTGSSPSSLSRLEYPLSGKGESHPGNWWWNFGRPDSQYLYEKSGGFVRIESLSDSKLGVFEYDQNRKLTGSRKIALKLPIFGGFYAGDKYNYVVTGQRNPSQDNNLPVVNVTAYTRDWKEAASANLRNINTTVPFDAGGCSIAQAENSLMIHTCHEMYRSQDGLNHQANMTFLLDASTLQEIDGASHVSNPSTGYVSHSFMQKVRTDGKSFYRADLGDAYPRALFTARSDVADRTAMCSAGLSVFPISGSIGDNFTGVQFYDLALSETNVLSAGVSADQKDPRKNKKNVFITISDKNLREAKTVWITDYEENQGPELGQVRLVNISDNTFILLWEETRGASTVVRAVGLDDQGNQTTEKGTYNTALSTSPAVFWSDGTIRWFRNDSQGNATLQVIHPAQINLAASQRTAPAVVMKRLYNPNSGEHFYTANETEKTYLVSVGWKDEGTGWKAPQSSKIPVYRLYNPNAGDHHYTMNSNEKDALIKTGWRYEGIGWYSDEAKGVPLYRQYNPNAKAGSHNYTVDKNENDYLVKAGWRAEGIGWYGLK